MPGPSSDRRGGVTPRSGEGGRGCWRCARGAGCAGGTAALAQVSPAPALALPFPRRAVPRPAAPAEGAPRPWPLGNGGTEGAAGPAGVGGARRGGSEAGRGGGAAGRVLPGGAVVRCAGLVGKTAPVRALSGSVLGCERLGVVPQGWGVSG